jgi:iron complex outermembrane recepter protein
VVHKTARPLLVAQGSSINLSGEFMFKRTQISTGVLLALGSVLLAPVAVQAQDSQRIEVTGSRIKRVDAETASPVQVITKEDIEQSGKGTVAEYLQTLTADGQGSVPFTYGRGFSGATSAGISLRGLGANATLVLINGRRSAPAVLADDAQRSYTDLNQIPLEAVERVEVLKDGASSIYGSDAVAGVVNIILKKNFVGTTAKVTYGTSQKSDGNEPRVALTHGFGDLGKDGYNVLLNAELGKKEAIYLRDRRGRNGVGVSAIGQPRWGFDPDSGPTNNIGRAGGDGWIPGNPSATSGRLNNSADPSIIGNVRDPATLDYYSRGDAAGAGFTRTFADAQAYCLANVNLPQNNPQGGCITDIRQQYNQVQPEQKTGSFFARITTQINTDVEAFAEYTYYRSKSVVDALPPSISGGYFLPDGTVVSQAATSLGADHPDNPYFGTAARLRYRAIDLGQQSVKADSNTNRFVAGVRGALAGWDFDTGVTYSEVRQKDLSRNLLNVAVKNALLNPTAANVALANAASPAYDALPDGSFYRIGENAGLNTPEVLDALIDDKARNGWSRNYGVDISASRDIGQLAGGAARVAVGGEIRREANRLPFYDGLGEYIGLSLTAYGGKRDIYAAYAEVLLPVLKQFEVNAALRHDRYSDAGSSTTPKLGVKWTPLSQIALRGTYARGFRAPSSTENNINSVAAFGGPNIDDNVRCAALTAAGLPQATVDANCRGIAPTFVQRGNPALKPEKSESTTLGVVWDVTPATSLTADVWQIKRKGLPVTEDGQQAIDNGQLTRDPTTALAAGDPGAILNAFVVFQNSDRSLTRGIDLEAKQRFDLGGGFGKLTFTGTWTHLLKQQVTTASGVTNEYAGTHGNCDITNCIGSPKDRISLAATWDSGPWRLGANVNYRGSMSNKLEKSDTECAQTLLNGEDFPSGCKLKSFTTLDVSGAWRISKNFELFGSIANLLDSKPPADFETYGAIGYNPLDYSGAIGRFYRLGLKASF